MPFIYNNGIGNKVGSLIYNDNGTEKRVMYAYMGDGSDGQEVYRGGNYVTYCIDMGDLLNPIYETVWRWTGENVLQDLGFTPTKVGYEFMGWSHSDEPCTPSGGGLYSELTMIGDPITIYANFKKDVTVKSYVYDAANTSFYTDYESAVVYNNGNTENPKFTISPTSMRDYNFIGWSAGSPSSDTPKSPRATITYQTINNVEFSEDTNVYAIYHYKDNIQYGYAVNGSVARMEGAVAINAFNTTNAYEEQTQTKAYPILTLADPTKLNASFLGWSTDINSREIDYYPINSQGSPKVDHIPITQNLMFYSVFKYGDSPDPLDPTQTRKILINGDHQQEGRIDGNNSNTWLRLYDENGNELSYDCSMFERVDASGVCSLDQGVGLYLRETYGGNQSHDGNDGSEPPIDKHGMLNGTFGNVLLELPESGTTILCVGVMSNSIAYVSNVNVNGGVRLIGRTTVG